MHVLHARGKNVRKKSRFDFQNLVMRPAWLEQEHDFTDSLRSKKKYSMFTLNLNNVHEL